MKENQELIDAISELMKPEKDYWEFYDKWGRGRPSKEKLERRKKHNELMIEYRQKQMPFINAMFNSFNSPENVVRVDENGNEIISVSVTYRGRINID